MAKRSNARTDDDHSLLITGYRLFLLHPASGLLRHTGKMLIAASFRTWRGSHLTVAQGRTRDAAGKYIQGNKKDFLF